MERRDVEMPLYFRSKLGFEISPSPLWTTNHLDGSNLSFRPHLCLSYYWEAFSGLGFSFRIVVKFCHVFWPCFPLRFLWRNGNVTKLLVAVPMFRSWKLGSRLLHELLGIGLFCSSAQTWWVVFVVLANAINNLGEIFSHQEMGCYF